MFFNIIQCLLLLIFSYGFYNYLCSRSINVKFPTEKKTEIISTPHLSKTLRNRFSQKK